MTAAAIENPYAGQGAVLLDIGGDVGALVVTTPATMVGVEVEIRPVGTPPQVVPDHDHHHDHHEHGHGHGPGGHHPHVAVVARPVGGRLVPSLVYPELVEGRYELYVKETDDVVMTVTIVGGEVAAAEWPG
ncbi:hypothetical protein GCM10027596_31490 [Nocardioides korecus]